MSNVGQPERATQRRIVALLKSLGWTYLGDWHHREGNANVEPLELTPFLRETMDYDETLVGRALRELTRAAGDEGKGLYYANRDVYGMLRYGIKVAPEAGENKVTVWPVDWAKPQRNRFAFAEEVTVEGRHDKRPDLVLYVNGIALGVLELKRSTVSVAEGIRQNLDSQKKEFIGRFFNTVGLVMAGNDTEGLRYGVIDTPEEHMLTWKEPGGPENALDRGVTQFLEPSRFLEILHDFVVFDGGTKKTARHNQYFGVKAAQRSVRRREGGVIWHTQGSGKSLTMVWLARWILENVAGSRVLVVTDRTELDAQIEKVFADVGETLHRCESGGEMMHLLNETGPPLLSTLIMKFPGAAGDGTEEFLAELASKSPKGFLAKGDLYVFVDECHRTQAGKLHRGMKAVLPEATFIGFTGTPLLREDKETSNETFGPYIHTYKFDEAVRDKVVLDLRYEARDIDQEVTNQAKIDAWFDAKTQGLNDVAKSQLKERWGTMRKVLSSRGRLEKIVDDILMDFGTRDRLMSGRGNAMLVSDSIYNACRFYDIFEGTSLKGRTAIVTSYRAGIADVKGEESLAGKTERVMQHETYVKMLNGMEPEAFETEAKRRFVKEPGQMRLLIVVDKLLTGFDAPSATYLYIDKKMQDHGLFQAICRVNRLDGEDKEYGYVVDYKDLFKSIEGAFEDYTKEALGGYDQADIAGLLMDRVDKGRDRLEDALESLRALCEDVEPPQGTDQFIRYFCPSDVEDAAERVMYEGRRVTLYTLTAGVIRAYANLANDMPAAGYSESEIAKIHAEVDHWTKVREIIRKASSDYIDLKRYEPDMRRLIDSYIRADDSSVVSTLDDLSLVQLLVERGDAAVEALPEEIQASQKAVAETIENNVRKTIIEERPSNPKYYDLMSSLLDALLRERRNGALDYAAYLKRIVELTKRVKEPAKTTAYPPSLTTGAKRALYDNLEKDEALTLRVDTAILKAREADWRGNLIRERGVRKALYDINPDEGWIEATFEIVKAQRDY